MAGTLSQTGLIGAGLTWTYRVVVASVLLINAQYVSLICPCDAQLTSLLGSTWGMNSVSERR